MPVAAGALVLAIGATFGMNAGYAINPARDFGPRLFTALAGWGGDVFRAGNGWWWVPLVATPVGALIGGFCLRPVHHPVPPSADGPRAPGARDTARPCVTSQTIRPADVDAQRLKVYRAASVAETTLGEIAACLWDLRAQCEQAMRTLTDAQRLTEDYRDADRHQNLVRRRLLADLTAAIRTNAAIADAAHDCLGLVEQPAARRRERRVAIPCHSLRATRPARPSPRSAPRRPCVDARRAPPSPGDGPEYF